MEKTRPNFTAKLNVSKPPEVKPVPKDGAGMKAGQMMLIASPMIFDVAVRAIPKGKAIDVPTLRRQLAAAHGADVTCPLTSGIFLRIVTEAAHEAYAAGAPVGDVTPVWRVIDAKSPMVKKLTFDPTWIFDQRTREGI
ncbi:MAG: hypothetical protein RLZZ58_1144 [Pseudomonadota bacterium]